jgi:hypothetical protein
MDRKEYKHFKKTMFYAFWNFNKQCRILFNTIAIEFGIYKMIRKLDQYLGGE